MDQTNSWHLGPWRFRQLGGIIQSLSSIWASIDPARRFLFCPSTRRSCHPTRKAIPPRNAWSMDVINVRPPSRAPEADRPRKRRLRKGTRSCWECKRRKVRCIPCSEEGDACLGCKRRGAHCVSQDGPVPDEFPRPADKHAEMAERMERVEGLLGRLVQNVPVLRRSPAAAHSSLDMAGSTACSSLQVTPPVRLASRVSSKRCSLTFFLLLFVRPLVNIAAYVQLTVRSQLSRRQTVIPRLPSPMPLTRPSLDRYRLFSTQRSPRPRIAALFVSTAKASQSPCIRC